MTDRTPKGPRVLVAALAAALLTLSADAAAPAVGSEAAPVVRAVASGRWSRASTWDVGRLPRSGDRVLVPAGRRVEYDVDSDEVIRLLQVVGTLEFARDRDTRLEVGLLKIVGDEDLSEEGFDCDAAPEPDPAKREHHGHHHGAHPHSHHAEAASRPELLVGTQDRPIPAGRRALIRLHHLEGMDKQSCPAIVCCAGRMEFHGAPIENPWSKLGARAHAGQKTVWAKGSTRGWRAGDRVLVTRTRRRMTMLDAIRPGAPAEQDENELHTVRALGQLAWPSKEPATTYEEKEKVPAGARLATTNGFAIHLEEPLRFSHDARGDYRGEVANLSRNVVVESADPDGVRGHTMYHHDSVGSIGYAEFRHLGKRGVLGRYPIHFHLLDDTMRGSSVRGASIWDSHNRWIAIHGTNYMVVTDCVGFGSVGHGYFLEDGSETMNVLDRNLAVNAREGKPLPEQGVAFDQNLGAGFWWANCYNSFTNNVAVDCDDYGYRYDAKRADGFDPVLPVLRPDGSYERVDIRSLPFIAFRGNEAHTMRSGGVNLRGPSRPKGMIYEKLNRELVREIRESIPDRRYPFWVHNFRAWDCSWAYHTGIAGVFLEGFDAYANDYAVWRSVLDRQVWKNTSIHGTLNKDLHMPYSIGLPDGDDATQLAYLAAIQGFVDDFPPVTVITRATRKGGRIVVRGAAADSTEIVSVWVNGVRAAPLREGYSEWEAVLPEPADGPTVVEAHAEDVYGNTEPRPHRVKVN